MTTLTDRYVWAVLRAVPESQRAELEPEIRALVADAAEAQAAESTPEAAERAALLELGDPDVLAGRYVDRTRFLIGPRLYPEWQRLLTMLLSILIPLIAIVAGAATSVGGGTVGEAVTGAIGAAIGVAVQTVFWVTLVFAVIERTAGAQTSPAREWTPEQLRSIPAPRRVGLGEVVAAIVANVVVILVIVWGQAMALVTIDGTSYALFDPSLSSTWLPWFIAVAGIEILFAIALYLRGRWTWGLAIVNALLNAAFAVPAVWLLQNDLLFNPALVDRLDAIAGGAWFAPTTSVITVVIVIIVAIDTLDGFRKAWRTSSQAGPAPMVA